jgi:hypothetical protein
MEIPFADRYRRYLEQSFIVAFAAGAFVFMVLFGAGLTAVGQALFYAAASFLMALILAFVVSCAADQDVLARFIAWWSYPNPARITDSTAVEAATAEQP